jgi:hypothetical protein
VDRKWFDGSTSYVEAHRRLQTLAGNAAWVPTYTPRPFTQRGTIRRLLTTFHRHNMCCFLAGTFAMFTAGILHSLVSAAVFVAMTNVHAQLVHLIFRTGADPPQQFLVSVFEFVFEDEEPGLDVYFYTTTRGNFSMLFSFFGVDSLASCGPLPNLNFVNFIWDHSERLSFVKYAILLFPSHTYRPPILLFLKYHRARSDGWTDIDGCLACVERYQRSIRHHNNCRRSDNSYCDICRHQPPSLRDSASHILFLCILDLERFELTCYTLQPVQVCG